MVDLLSFLIFILSLLIFGSLYWYLTIPKNLPPGPIGIPLLGNALEYRQGSNQHLLVLDHIKKYGPIFRLYLANKLVIILGDHESIQEAMVKQGDIFSGRPQIHSVMPDKINNQGIIFTEGDLWKEHRRFALATLRDLGIGRPIIEPHIREEIDHLTERLQTYASNGTAFDPQNLLTCSVSNVISQLIFGNRFSYDDQEFVDHFTKLSRRDSNSDVGVLSPFVLSAPLATLAQLLPFVRQNKEEEAAFCEYAERQMNKTIKTFDPDSEPTNYIHAYLKAAKDQQSGTFTNIQLLASAFELFAAGTTTTSTTLRYAFLLLASNPEIQGKMFHEIKEQIGTSSLPNYADRAKLPFCEAVIMEAQRFGNLLPLGVFRRTLAPTKLMGYDIPEGTTVIPFLTNILHNPEFFPDPTKFDPDRFSSPDGKVIRDPKLVPFGLGKRICLGESLARMELFLLLIGLISRFHFYFPDDQPRPSLKPLVGLLSAPVPYQVCVKSRSD